MLDDASSMHANCSKPHAVNPCEMHASIPRELVWPKLISQALPANGSNSAKTKEGIGMAKRPNNDVIIPKILQPKVIGLENHLKLGNSNVINSICMDKDETSLNMIKPNLTEPNKIDHFNYYGPESKSIHETRSNSND